MGRLEADCRPETYFDTSLKGSNMTWLWIYLGQIIFTFVGLYFVYRKKPVVDTSDMKLFAFALVPVIGFSALVVMAYLPVSEYCSFRVWKNPFYHKDKK